MEWNDGRLDDLSKRVDRMDRKMEEGFVRLEGKFDALHRLLFQAAWAFAIGLFGLLGVVVAKF